MPRGCVLIVGHQRSVKELQARNDMHHQTRMDTIKYTGITHCLPHVLIKVANML